MIRRVSSEYVPVAILTDVYGVDYEQQRRHLLRKYGIDLVDGSQPNEGMKTRRMERKEVELIMGDGNGQVGIFTWREKNRRKVCELKQLISLSPSIYSTHFLYCAPASILRVSPL